MMIERQTKRETLVHYSFILVANAIEKECDINHDLNMETLFCVLRKKKFHCRQKAFHSL